MTDKSTFRAAGDALALARGQIPDKASDQLRQMAALKRIPGEDQEEYFAFREYVFSGPRRSFKEVGLLIGRSEPWVKLRSKTHKWETRCLIFDETTVNLAALKYQDEVGRMAVRQARIGRIMQVKSELMIRKINPDANHKLSDISTFVRAATEIERKAHGVADKTEKVVTIVAAFQEAANKKVVPDDPQDAGNGEPVTTFTETSRGVFEPEPLSPEEAADF